MEAMSSAPSSPIRHTGPWTQSRVWEFLDEARIPMRLAANTASGFPVVLSLWFLPEDDELLAAVHRDARIAKRLKADPRCAFEIAPNEPPYCGVRGRAMASLEPEGARADRSPAAHTDRLLGLQSTHAGRAEAVKRKAAFRAKSVTVQLRQGAANSRSGGAR
jgi:hypothetical protein